MLSYEGLKDRPKDLLAATGLTAEEFEELLPVFAEGYQTRFGIEQTVEGRRRQRRGGAGGKARLNSAADKLLFILVYTKTYPLQTMLGLQFDLSQGRVNIWIHRLLPVLDAALDTQGHVPERDGAQVAGSPLVNEGGADLIIDGTERRRQRPSDDEQQHAQYSGKKKTHTDKNVVLVNRYSQKVAYLGATRPGKTHDKKLADEAAIAYPDATTLGKDTGFQGYEPQNVVTWQPKKAPRSRANRR
jgi:hypothetical protein